jgi:hypothetical protein
MNYKVVKKRTEQEKKRKGEEKQDRKGETLNRKKKNQEHHSKPNQPPTLALSFFSYFYLRFLHENYYSFNFCLFYFYWLCNSIIFIS